MLEETLIFDGLASPKDIGGVCLKAATLDKVISIAPLKGQVMGVADVLRPLVGMILPPAGQFAQSETAQSFWYRPGQWLVFGEAGLMGKTSKALTGMAAVADMSDAFIKLSLSGGAVVPVLSRLCALDLEMMPEGYVADSSLADIPVTVLAVEGGFELLVPRSYAGSAIMRLETAMRSVAALSVL